MKIKKSELTKIIKEVVSELSPKDRKNLKEKLLKESDFDFGVDIDGLQELASVLKQAKSNAGPKVKAALKNAEVSLSSLIRILIDISEGRISN